MPDLFLSYSSPDKPFAAKLAHDLESAGASVCYDIAEIKIDDSLIEKINEGINTEKFIGIVLSPNPNVFYEVGLCHAIGKDVLLLSQSVEDIPFDLRHRRVIQYDYTLRGCIDLESCLYEAINSMLNE
jgi:hypothetical protein